MKDVELLKEPFKALVKEFLSELAKAGIRVLISETLRTPQVQAAYFAQGRKALAEVNRLRVSAGLWQISEKENKSKVTWTLKSKHLDGLAIDVVPEKDGTFWWNAPDDVWKKISDVGVMCGLESGYTWKQKDAPHFEMRTV